jgi:hypothetical protein
VGRVPYADLGAVNRSRSREEMEYELVDTGGFGEDRYFDVEVEHAKAGPEDILCRVTVHNRSAQDAALHVLPTLWFRNTWSLGDDERQPRLTRAGSAHPVIRAEHDELGVLHLHAEPEASLLFCENETKTARLWGKESTTRFAKDGIGDCVLHGADTVNPAGEGTKAAAHIRLEVPAGGQAAVLVRLTREGPEELPAPFADADGLITGRRAEAGCASATPTRCGRPRIREAAMSRGSTCSTTTSCRCPTSGSTRGTRPGTSPFTAFPWPSSARTSPRARSI